MSAYSDRVIADGASAYWRLNEPSGTTAVDIIGGFNGTISGGVTLNQAGALTDGNRAMAFDGASGQITIASFTNPVPLTVEAWIKTTTTGVFRTIVGNPSEANGIFVGVSDLEHISIYTGGTAILASVRTVSDNQWHHIVYISTGTQATVYIDGVLDTGPMAETRATAAAQLGIGGRSLQYFNGSL